MNWPGFHSTAWYGPVPTTGGSFLKNPAFSGSPIWASEYFDQMCFGRIGT